MLFFDIPEMPPQMAEVRPAHVAAAKFRRAEPHDDYGYCMIETDVSGGSIDIARPLQYLIPKRILKALDRSAQLGVSVLAPNDEAWLVKWENAFSVEVLRKPDHGEFQADAGSNIVGYVPEKGYAGKDRIDILIKGKDPDGRPVSANASIYIRTITKDHYHELSRSDSKYRTYLKQNCPVPAEFWKIDHKPAAGASEGRPLADESCGSGHWLTRPNLPHKTMDERSA